MPRDNHEGCPATTQRQWVSLRAQGSQPQTLQGVKRLVMGRRRSRQKAFSVILTPGGAWRSLY